MTAEKVGTLKVVAVEQVIGRANGGVVNPAYDRLVLENGDKVYGCKSCTYASNNTGSMHGHVKRHHVGTRSAEPAEQTTTEEPVMPTEAPIVKAVMDMSVGELLAYVASLEADGERPEALRVRAETAEKEREAAEARVAELEAQLSAIRTALG